MLSRTDDHHARQLRASRLARLRDSGGGLRQPLGGAVARGAEAGGGAVEVWGLVGHLGPPDAGVAVAKQLLEPASNGSPSVRQTTPWGTDQIITS